MKKKGISLLSLASMALVSFAGVGGIIASSVSSSKEGIIDAYLDEEEREFVLANPLKPLYTPNDQYYSSKQYVSHNHVGDIESVWDNYRGSGTKIAIIDTGINYKHPDFKKSDGTTSILGASKYYYLNSDKTAVFHKTASSDGYDVLLHDWDSEYSEWDAHGTNSAGCAAARTGDGVGTIGIAPEADILAYKTDMYLTSISYAIQDAVNQGADVINMSLGAYAETFTDGFNEQQTGSSDVATYLQNIIDYAHNNGVIVIAAAGNEKTPHHSYPACNTHVIGVGALASNSSTTAATFSNYNYSSETDPEGDHNVDVVAPGYVYTPDMGGTQSSINYSAYCSTQGTSFASPIVAGAAALWKEKHPSGTPNQFKEDLYASCVDIGTSGFDYKYGNGRLDVGALLEIDEVDRVSLETTDMSIYTNEKPKSITVTYASGKITWSSDNTNIATVDSNGNVTPKASGTTKIWARVGEASAYVNLTVKQYISATSIALNPASCEIAVGGSATINATVLPSNATDKTVLFESLDESIATVDDDGVVEGKKAGSTQIYCMGPDDTEEYFDVTVKANSELVYTKVTSSMSDYSGDYLFVYSSGTTNLAMNGGLSTLDVTNNTISVDVVNNQIAASDTVNAANFHISKSATDGKYYIKSASGYYIYSPGTKNGLSTTTSASSTCDNTISMSGTQISIGSGSKILAFNSATDQMRFRYLGIATNFDIYKLGSGSVEKPDKELSSISVSYTGGDVYIGDELDTSKITVTAKYNYPSYYPDETVTGWTYSGFNSSTKGSTTVTVTYKGKTATFNVNIIQNPNSPLSSITVSGVPETIKYRDTFNKSLVTVTAHYEAKDDAIVTSSVTLPDIDTSVLGEHKYTVSYTENGITKSASVTYKVTNNGAIPVETIGSASYSLVASNSELVVGSRYLIVSYGTTKKAMGSTLTSGALNSVSFTESAGPGDGAQVVTLVRGTTSSNWAFSLGDGKYLGCGSSTSLNKASSIAASSSWTISVNSSTSTHKATITNVSQTSSKIRYNSSKFQAMTSSGTETLIYKVTITESSVGWTGEQQALSFASYFLSKTTQGCSDRDKGELSAPWSEISAEYGYMIDDAKDAFVTSSDSTIVEARERYRIILANHGLEPFVVDSSGNALYAAAVRTEVATENTEGTVIVMFAFSLSAMGCFLLLKRKKA